METSPIDLPSSPSPLLVKLFEEAILSLMLMSKAKAIRLESESARAKPGTTAPPPSSGPEDALQDQWERCLNNRQRLVVLKRAQKAVQRARYGGTKSERFAGTLDWKIAVARDPRPAPVIANVYGISPSYVRTLRGRYGARSGPSGSKAKRK